MTGLLFYWRCSIVCVYCPPRMYEMQSAAAAAAVCAQRVLLFCWLDGRTSDLPYFEQQQQPQQQ